MKLSHKTASQLLAQYTQRQKVLQTYAEEAMCFRYAPGEEPDLLRPPYEYEQSLNDTLELNQKIRIITHAIKKFEISTKVPHFDLTLDQALQLNGMQDSMLQTMKSMIVRVPVRRSITRKGAVEYDVANYNISKVTADYENLLAEQALLKEQLNKICVDKLFEVDL